MAVGARSFQAFDIRRLGPLYLLLVQYGTAGTTTSKLPTTLLSYTSPACIHHMYPSHSLSANHTLADKERTHALCLYDPLPPSTLSAVRTHLI